MENYALRPIKGAQLIIIHSSNNTAVAGTTNLEVKYVLWSDNQRSTNCET